MINQLRLAFPDLATEVVLDIAGPEGNKGESDKTRVKDFGNGARRRESVVD